MFVSQLGLDLATMLSNSTVWIALILVIIGMSLSFLSARITRLIRKTSEVSSDDKILVLLRAIGLVLIILGLIFLIIMLLSL